MFCYEKNSLFAHWISSIFNCKLRLFVQSSLEKWENTRFRTDNINSEQLDKVNSNFSIIPYGRIFSNCKEINKTVWRLNCDTFADHTKSVLIPELFELLDKLKSVNGCCTFNVILQQFYVYFDKKHRITFVKMPSRFLMFAEILWPLRKG